NDAAAARCCRWPPPAATTAPPPAPPRAPATAAGPGLLSACPGREGEVEPLPFGLRVPVAVSQGGHLERLRQPRGVEPHPHPGLIGGLGIEPREGGHAPPLDAAHRGERFFKGAE